MKKNNSLLVFSCLAVFLFASCGGNTNAKAEENNVDSVTTQTNQNIETDNSIKKIAFEIFVDSGTIELAAGEEDSPSALFKEEILVVTEVPSQTNLEEIQAILQKKQNYSGDAKQALAKKKKEYLEGYVDANSEEVIGMSAEWDRDLSVQVIFNDDYFTTIGFYLDEYGGGAHSYSTASFVILDLKNSKQITLSDIFDEKGLALLKQKMLDRALEIAKNNNASSLEEYDFFVDAIEPTESFTITETGIEFSYDRGEIRPYSSPAPSFFFKWNEIKDIIKTDASVRSLIVE
ncbi:RsiV family protein [Bernardetia sp. Wsw4-3y2]|uniref:RsiV family protein n=1 Tax=Bernardetia sp. Wsw4-3y2 TaxID=3127471 RepID=UPI0030CD2E90